MSRTKRNQVDENVCPLDGGRQRSRVRDVACYPLNIRLWKDRAVAGRTVETTDLVSVLEQEGNQPRSAKSRCTGEENLHAFTRVRRKRNVSSILSRRLRCCTR